MRFFDNRGGLLPFFCMFFVFVTCYKYLIICFVCKKNVVYLHKIVRAEHIFCKNILNSDFFCEHKCEAFFLEYLGKMQIRK